MADDLLSSAGTKVLDFDDLFSDADGFNNQKIDEFFNNQKIDEFFPYLNPPDNELLKQQEPDAHLSGQQNLEVTSSSILNRGLSNMYGASSGNHGGGLGMYSSSECWSVGSEYQSQSSVQNFQPGVASYGQKIAQDESNQKSALPPGEEVPKLGMVFSSEEEGYKFYTNYATKIGFKVRKAKIQRLTDGTVRKRSFYCSKEGLRSENKSSKTRKYQRKETRTGCNAMVQLTHDTDSGKWKITHIVLEHNHDTNVPNHRHITLPSTNISEKNSQIDITNKAVMLEEMVVENSPESFPFDNLRNCYLCNENINVLPPEDSQSLVDFLDNLQLENPSFFYTVQLGVQSRTVNFFWRDGRSKIDYKYFGDVLILDTTFRIKKYGIICALLLGVNHHQQYIIFGCAFLVDDSIESFIWLFRTFLKAMGNCQPRAIFTDEHQAVSDAIELELRETQHHIGMWYVNQNARKELSEAFKLPHFEDEFNKCISGYTLEEEFFLKWQSLFQTYELRENSWLNALYNMRKKWSPIFSKGIYSAGIGSLKGCENITNVFHNLTSDTITLSKFVRLYLRVTEQLREEELCEDFCCNESKQPMILENSKLEKEAADAYTDTIFKLFQEELRRCQSLVVEKRADNGSIFIFKITDEGHKYNFVEYNYLKSRVTCNCKKFESIGILCSHALKVLDATNINCLPSCYILKRWTKFAKYGMVTDDRKQEIVHQSKGQSSSFTCRVMNKALNVITKSVAIEENQKIVENHLDMALKEVENVLKAKMTRHLDGRDAEIYHRNGGLNGIDCMEAQRKVPNPPCSSQQEPKVVVDFTLTSKEENQVSLTERKSCDDAVVHYRLLKEARKELDGNDQRSCTSHGGQHYVRENSLEQLHMPTENMEMPLAMPKRPRNI